MASYRLPSIIRRDTVQVKVQPGRSMPTERFRPLGTFRGRDSLNADISRRIFGKDRNRSPTVDEITEHDVEAMRRAVELELLTFNKWARANGKTAAPPPKKDHFSLMSRFDPCPTRAVTPALPGGREDTTLGTRACPREDDPKQEYCSILGEYACAGCAKQRKKKRVTFRLKQSYPNWDTNPKTLCAPVKTEQLRRAFPRQRSSTSFSRGNKADTKVTTKDKVRFEGRPRSSLKQSKCCWEGQVTEWEVMQRMAEQKKASWEDAPRIVVPTVTSRQRTDSEATSVYVAPPIV
ncbi:uncharacterized protein LOC144867279 [Branchiostoma floridae x Branchiostoma japonicum]